MAAAKAKTKSVKYLLIPSDESLPIKEQTLTFDVKNEIGAMGEAVRAHFQAVQAGLSASAESKFRASLRDQIAAKVGGGGAGGAGGAVSNQLLDQFSAMCAFDMISLLQHTKETGLEGVNLYVDDQAIAKGFALNKRASLICTACGKPTNVMGDAFIARIADDDSDYFERRDFTLADISGLSAADPNTPTPKWIIQSRAQSAAKAAKSQADTNQQIHSLLTSAGKPKPCAVGGCSNIGANRCSRCREVWYCSVDCQRKDWTRHKPTCSKSAHATKTAAAKSKSKAAPSTADGQTAAAATTSGDANAAASTAAGGNKSSAAPAASS